MNQESIMKVYEVGAFEKYEEGFHAFYRTLDKAKALRLCEKVQEHMLKIPKIDLSASDEEYKAHMEVCALTDKEFKNSTGVDLSLSDYANGFYEIQVLWFDLD